MVDGQPVARIGVKTVLEAVGNITVVGEAGSAEEAFDLVKDMHSGVVVLDLDLEGGEDGLELCRRVKALPEPPGVIVFSARNCPEDIFRSQISGADSFVYKGEEPNKLLEAVKETQSGKRVWFMGEGEGCYASSNQSFHADSHLTQREKEIFVLLLRHYTNPQIARELSISLQTAKNHVSHVLKKCGARSRHDIA